MADIYETLRARLDSMSTGFPKTKNKSEIKVLKRLFTEEHAELFLALTVMPETPEQAAERLGRDSSELADMMEEMAQKGLLFRIRENGVASYSCVPYIVGLAEFQINALKTDKELATDMAMHFMDGFVETLQSLETHHQRTIPVNTGLVSQWPIAPYEDAIAMLKKQKRIAVANCACRSITHQVVPDPCGKPLETCMMFGSGADYYIENGWGREIDVEEAVSILKLCDEHALVVQPVNSKKAGAICACCGDCCWMLNSLKMQAKPAESVKSNYFAQIDGEECTGCEICLDRCQMKAITIEDEIAVLDRDRCIGCGLCVTTCPSEAASLVKKSEDQLYEPPENHVDMYIKMGMERGVI
ncbi:MAG: 4Fe-4S binding protein [Desulfobacteraceae bacterium]|nr:4Fe-4S binding protein [Desulfobacteraceae bacterium]MBC2757672.1 4Fe-4S binding protein [Desulfobacteraceae bacterium]